MIVVAVLLVVAGAEPDPEARARSAEAAAFAAVDGKQWCDAVLKFLEANALAPSPDLVFNAAQAAELGSDRAQAMQLYTQLLGTTTSSDRKSEAKKRIAALTKRVEKEGPGVACAAPAPLAVVADAPVSTPAVPVAVPAPTPPPATEAPAPSAWPWVTAGLGGAGMLGGAALALVGAQPYFAHASARDALLAAEKQGSTDGVELLYARQESARAEWEGFGQAAVAAGLAGATVGVVAVSGGIIWGVVAGGGE